MPGRHCPGCRGYTEGWQEICPGVDSAVLPGGALIPRLPWGIRLWALRGKPFIAVGNPVTPGPDLLSWLAEHAGAAAADDLAFRHPELLDSGPDDPGGSR